MQTPTDGQYAISKIYTSDSDEASVLRKLVYYVHGKVKDDIADISIIGMREINKGEGIGRVEETGYELLSDEDLINEITKEEKKNEEK